MKINKIFREDKPFLMRTEKNIILVLRLIIFANLLAAGILEQRIRSLPWYFWFILGIFIFSELGFLFESPKKFRGQKIWGWIFLFDFIAISLLIFYLGGRVTELFIAYAFTIAIAAISRSAAAAFFTVILAVIVYAILPIYEGTTVEFLSSPFMIRVSFLFAIAFFVSYLSEEVQKERTLKVQVEERLKSETDLKQKVIAAKEYIENIINSMTDTLIVVDPNGKMRTINPATAELLGYKKDELVGQPVAAIFEEDDEDEEETPFKGTGMKKLIEAGSIRNYEATYLTKDKGGIPVSLSGSVMRDDEGNLVGIIVVARDMRARKQLDEQMKKRMEALEEFAKEYEAWSEKEKELKQEINGLLKKLGRPEKYTLV